jgi:uncharacterized RDD family membrane protein YckC
MGCPQCHSDEISPSGACLICGYRTIAEPAEPPENGTEVVSEEAPGYPGMIEMDCSEGATESSEKSEVPEWRQQLSQRLHEIKQKREAVAATKPESKTSVPVVPQASGSESLSSMRAKLVQKAEVRKPKAPSAPMPLQRTLQSIEPPPLPKAEAPPPASTDPQEIRKLIDTAVSRQASQTSPPSVVCQPSASPLEAVGSREDKLILLSRTLSGLIDLIIVMICTGAFIFAADYFSGIVSMDNFSLVLFSLVFLLNYFVYSLFFLAASNQTIGMMITELRVVGMDENRPSVRRILQRCCGYLVSFFCLGIGLLLGLFDRESRCFHDRISGTHIVRI